MFADSLAFIQVFRESRNSPYLYDYLVGLGAGALPFTQSQSSSVIGIQLFISLTCFVIFECLDTLNDAEDDILTVAQQLYHMHPLVRILFVL
jgi:hypothetical protein